MKVKFMIYIIIRKIHRNVRFVKENWEYLAYNANARHIFVISIVCQRNINAHLIMQKRLNNYLSKIIHLWITKSWNNYDNLPY